MKMLIPFSLSLVLAVTPIIADYAPLTTLCSTTALVRDATGLSDSEEAYRITRKAVADSALRSWLGKTNSEFGTAYLPSVALTTSGGGYRSLLSGAGVVQALDSRDSNLSTNGLYQALTYHAGLSGGAWLLSSIAGNNYPTISYLKENLWKQAFQDSPLVPGQLLVFQGYTEIVGDIVEKEAAGFDTTLVDPYGRLLSYQLLEEQSGGVSITLSSVSTMSNFTSFAAPFPVITALGAKVWLDECGPGPNATTYEFTPYEFGSWDSDLSAFAPMMYLGTTFKGGKATTTCTTNYDNLGYILGTSSNLFNALCLDLPDPSNSTGDLAGELAVIVSKAHRAGTSDLYGRYKNPFHEYISSTGTPNSANNISAQKTLSLVDGGLAMQNNPILPFLQPSRNISAIIVNDNSADTSTHYPNGSEILTTYVQSISRGLTRMPFIPPVETFIAQGLNKRATFFGCGDASKITIVYLPNHNYTFDSGTATSKLTYTKVETDAMIANGNQIATQGGKEGWPTCLGCALMMKSEQKLASACSECYAEYCYYE